MKSKILSALAVILCLCFGLAACNSEHIHDWTMRSNSDEHWQVCVDDEEEKPLSRASHTDDDNDSFCDDCGYKLPATTDDDDKGDGGKGDDGKGDDGKTDPVNPDAPFVPDQRNFWIVGNFAPSNWFENYRDDLKFTRQSTPDADGNTVYTLDFQFAEGNKFKIVNDAGSSYYDGELNASNLSQNAKQYFQAEGIHNNIQLKGTPGRYRITVRVNGSFAEVDAEPIA